MKLTTYLEEWKKITEVPKYSISNYGRVRNDSTGRFLKAKPDKNTYLRYGLYNGEKILNRISHRLVAIYFLDNPNKQPQVNHIDGNKQNNHVSNLEWVSNQENVTHAWKNNLMNPRPGIRHHNCKLTESDVFEIIQLAKSGVLRRDISAKYGISKNSITRITTGLRWSSLTKIGVK